MYDVDIKATDESGNEGACVFSSREEFAVYSGMVHVRLGKCVQN